MLAPVAAALIATVALALHSLGCHSSGDTQSSLELASGDEYASHGDMTHLRIGFARPEHSWPAVRTPRAWRLQADADPAVGGAPLSVQFRSALVGGHGATRPIWDFGDGHTLADDAMPIHTYLHPGTYAASVTVHMHGVTRTEHIEIDVRPEAFEVEILVDRDAGTAPLDVIFRAAVVDGGAGPFAYEWNFGDGTTSPLRSPRHTYQVPGDYIAQVTITAPTGQIGRDAFEINAAVAYAGDYH